MIVSRHRHSRWATLPVSPEERARAEHASPFHAPPRRDYLLGREPAAQPPTQNAAPQPQTQRMPPAPRQQRRPMSEAEREPHQRNESVRDRRDYGDSEREQGDLQRYQSASYDRRRGRTRGHGRSYAALAGIIGVVAFAALAVFIWSRLRGEIPFFDMLGVTGPPPAASSLPPQDRITPSPAQSAPVQRPDFIEATPD